jgi:hypothetical protein
MISGHPFFTQLAAQKLALNASVQESKVVPLINHWDPVGHFHLLR